MGLDVYLYRYEDFAATTAKEDAGNALYEDGSISREDRQRRFAEMGLDEWGEDKAAKQKVQIDSAKYPAHMFKIGYLRSSYNGGGINHILRDRTGKDLDWIFFGDDGADNDVYAFQPDWAACLERTRAALADFRAWRAQNGDWYVEAVRADGLRDDSVATDAADALQRFLAERGKQKAGGGFSEYSSALGRFDFSDNPAPVRALIVGRHFTSPCLYVIREAHDSDSGMDWYEQALEITAEMCEWALAQPDREKLYLHWSC